MPARTRDPLTWRVFGVLMAAALLGLLGIMPYVLVLLDRLPGGLADTLPPPWVVLPLQVVQSLVLVGAAIVLLDLGVFAPRLAGSGTPISTLRPPAWQGLLASVYGGVVEELGLMTLWVWAGTRLTRSAAGRPAVVWAAIVMSALIFGPGHLPTTATLLPLTPLVVARVAAQRDRWGCLRLAVLAA
jgi:hypothetical protein